MNQELSEHSDPPRSYKQNCDLWTLEWAQHSAQGQRDTMEDQFDVELNFKKRPDHAFFAVFDGHGGGEASKFAARNVATAIADQPNFDDNTKAAVKNAFLEVDAVFLEAVEKSLESEENNILKAGTTVVSVILKRDKIYCCNLGDSNAVMSNDGRAVVISKEHRPTQKKERERIEGAGTEIKRNRLGGRLAVPRGIGDAEFKNLEEHTAAASTAKPSVFPLTSKVDFLVIGCDGLWDVCAPQETINFVSKKLTGGDSLHDAAESLVNYALEKGSTDNVTVLLVRFDYPHSNGHHAHHHGVSGH